MTPRVSFAMHAQIILSNRSEGHFDSYQSIYFDKMVIRCRRMTRDSKKNIYANVEFTRASTAKAKLIENQILQTAINNKEVITVHCECLLVVFFQTVGHFSPFSYVAVCRSCHVKPCY